MSVLTDSMREQIRFWELLTEEDLHGHAIGFELRSTIPLRDPVLFCSSVIDIGLA